MSRECCKAFVLSLSLSSCAMINESPIERPVHAALEHANTAKISVPFNTAKGYFVRNDFVPGTLSNPIIADAETFFSVFGMATVMGKYGQPTPIDFGRQYVLVLIGDETRYREEFVAQSLELFDGTLRLKAVRRTAGPELSYSMVPLLIAVIDKSYHATQATVEVTALHSEE